MEYIISAEDRLNLPRQTISDYKRIGEAYIEYRHELEEIGFQEEGNLHKLRFLKLALKRHNKEKVFSMLTEAPFRKFKQLAYEPEEIEPEMEDDYNPEIKITESEILIDGKNILHLDPGLNPKVREEIAKYLRTIFRIRESGNEPVIVAAYDESEKRAIERKIQQFLKERRSKK